MFGVSHPTVRAWVRRGCPVIQKARKGTEWQLDTVAVFEWQKEQTALNIAGDISGLDIDEAKRRKLAAEAALCELDLAKVRGDVISIKEVGDVWLDIVSASRSRMLSIPAKVAAMIAPITSPMKIRSLLEAEIEEALDELNRFDQGNDTGSKGSAKKGS